MPKKLLLIDGNSLAFRAFYAMYNQLNRMVTHEGLHTNALVAFHNFLEGMVLKLDPDMALVAWDASSGRDTFRGQLFADYKAGRARAPEEFREQFPYMKKMVAYMGLHNYEQLGLEADDIIGTLAKIGAEAGDEVVVVTGDQDLIQLVNDRVSVKVTRRGISDVDTYTPAFIKEKFGLDPSQIIDKKALTGDTSDNYPGVTKVGEKTAIKLLHEYHDLDNLYAHVDEMKPSKLKENLINDKDQAYTARKLATIITDADLPIKLDELTYTGLNPDELVPFYQELDFKQALAKLHALQKSGQLRGLNEPEEKKTAEPAQPVTELTANNLSVLEKMTGEIALSFDFDDPNYHRANLIGFALGNDEVGYYGSCDISLLQEPALKQLLADEKIVKNVFHVKADLVLLKRLGLSLAGVSFDFLLVAYLLDTVGNDNLLSTLAQRFDIYLTSDEEFYGKGAKFAVPDDTQAVIDHMGGEAAAIAALKAPTLAKLKERDETHLYDDIELPLAYVLAEMEYQGFKVEPKRLEQMGNDLDKRIEALKDGIYDQAGGEFNLNSPKQLGVLLFEKMGLPVIKKTKTGYSTAVDVLEQLAPQAPIVDDILQYRQLNKIKSTYVDGLLSVINPKDSKIHTRFLQTLTQTGRLSSVDPNLQNIPMRTEEGRKIRQAFVPSHSDWLIFGADYSQIELRVLAHVTGDKNLQQAFLNDEDIHAETARAVFGLGDDEEVTPLQRRTAKAVNFGIVYGISDYGLAKNLGITRKEAQQFIDTYFHEFPKVHEWMDAIKALAHKQGYVTTIAERRRYLPDINAKNFNLRSFAERTAMNSPIQGSAADIIKIAMIKVKRALREHNLHANLLLQVHDELVFEAPVDEIDELNQVVTKVMDSAVKLDIPLKVESHDGPTWYDAK
ncbi:DNA polymerase I [Lactobacillaceae bacterium L1_55_11]|nr:DNA polymerase I [Lactobacillaceae bacterium L1_55_11]